MRYTGYEMARYKGTQASHLYEKSMHTLCIHAFIYFRILLAMSYPQAGSFTLAPNVFLPRVPYLMELQWPFIITSRHWSIYNIYPVNFAT